ncbi:MAG: response regulator [Calditrichaeota bacterium]|nr:MAG: response regulator [Calditrichota bacterium]
MSAYKILVVDDDYASRLMLKKALEQHDYEVILCSNGNEALKLLQEQDFDMLLTDLIMEGISGIDLLERVRELGKDLATILLTGHASIETAVQAVRLGANDYLLKPINLEELQIRVEKAFERIELERRLYEAERQLTYNATIATANHEINQPLTVIISAIDMIRMELQKLGIDNSRLNNYIQLMHKSSMRIAEILRRLREITHPKIQDVPLGMKMIDIQEGLEERSRDSRYILVIEDEENLRQIIQDVLDAESYKVILAETAHEGVDLYRADRHLIELVILDFNLPDADGLEVLQQLQAIDPSVKVLLTSGFDVDEAVQEALNRGALHFIRKPFNRQEILESVRKVYSYHPTM